jgi:hypothetical protein
MNSRDGRKTQGKWLQVKYEVVLPFSFFAQMDIIQNILIDVQYPKEVICVKSYYIFFHS